MNKHRLCEEEGCQLKAAKGYRDCSQASGCCDLLGPDFNTEANLHADTVAERHDAKQEKELDPLVKAFIDGYRAADAAFDPLDAYEKAIAYQKALGS